MKVTITYESEDEIKAAAKILAAINDTEETAAPPARRGRKPKDDEETDSRDPEELPEDEDSSNDADDDTDAESDCPTLAEVKAAFAKLIKAKGNDKAAAIKILKKFGVKKPEEIEEGDFDEVLTLIKKAQASKK